MPTLVELGRRGAVSAFDEPSGIGVITADDGDDVAFHCVSIADGTRVIDVGAQVTFDVMLKLGRREAVAIRPA